MGSKGSSLKHHHCHFIAKTIYNVVCTLFSFDVDFRIVPISFEQYVSLTTDTNDFLN